MSQLLWIVLLWTLRGIYLFKWGFLILSGYIHFSLFSFWNPCIRKLVCLICQKSHMLHSFCFLIYLSVHCSGYFHYSIFSINYAFFCVIYSSIHCFYGVFQSQVLNYLILIGCSSYCLGFPSGSTVKPTVQDTWFWYLGWEDPLEKGKPTHSSILA